MKNMKSEFVFHGDGIRIEQFPEETRFIFANPPLLPVPDFQQAVARALDQPLEADPLEKQLTSSSRVTIAFDDPCLPLPPMHRDVRGQVIESLLQRLSALAVPRENISLICANGLHRKWTLRELSLVLGKEVIRRVGADRISCHDATDPKGLVNLGTTPSGYVVEINRKVPESDIVIYVNLNYTSMNGGWKSILVGLGSWHCIRQHHTPRQWNLDSAIMNPRISPMHRMLAEMGALAQRRCNVFQIETVVNNRLWPPGIAGILHPLNHRSPGNGPGIPLRLLLRILSGAPRSLKRWVRRALRSHYQLCAVNAGRVEAVHQRTLEILYRQQNVKVAGPVDVLVFGVPNLSPYSAGSFFNPILLRSLVIGYLLGSFQNRPLLKKGGVLIACNPGIEKFHRRHHPAYIDFWRRDLHRFENPIECWDRLSESYARNPRYMNLYRHHYAYHGSHGLINWTWSGMGMKHPGQVILAGARQPETARKIGFIPARDFPTALGMAREKSGKNASIAYQVIPPLFSVEMEE